MDIATELGHELTLRGATRPSYSLRTFASHLGISPSTLSRIISRERVPSARLTAKIREQLALKSSESVEPVPKKTRLKNWQYRPIKEIDSILDWRALTLLELVKTPDFRPQPEWIAKKIGITLEEAVVAQKKLIDSQIVRVARNGKWVRSVKEFASNCIPRTEHRIAAEVQAHQIAIDTIKAPKEEKKGTHYTGMLYLPLRQSRLAEAELAMVKFIRQFSAEFMDTESSQIYAVNLSMFPVTHKE
jgi:transcriptional regulator with XRE-family HTH domain